MTQRFHETTADTHDPASARLGLWLLELIERAGALLTSASRLERAEGRLVVAFVTLVGWTADRLPRPASRQESRYQSGRYSSCTTSPGRPLAPEKMRPRASTPTNSVPAPRVASSSGMNAFK